MQLQNSNCGEIIFPQKPEGIISENELIFADEYVRGGLLLTTIESSKEVWMNKAKMFFNLEMQGIEIKPSLVQKLLKGNGTNAVSFFRFLKMTLQIVSS